MSVLVASMIGLRPHDMSGGGWVLVTLMMLVWAVLAIAAVDIAIRLTR